MNGELVIETRDLTKIYGDQVAVDHLNLKIYEGEVFGFLGPNGAGKTTTLLMLLGLSEPTSGKARVCGFDPTREPLKIKRIVGYLPENVGFYDDLNAVQNLLYISRLNGILDDAAMEKIKELLKIVDLEVDPRQKIRRIFSRYAPTFRDRRSLIKRSPGSIFRRTNAGARSRWFQADVRVDPLFESRKENYGFLFLPSLRPSAKNQHAGGDNDQRANGRYWQN